MGNLAYWEALDYSLQQHYLQTGLTTRGVIHCGVDRQCVFFDWAASNMGDWNRARDRDGAEGSRSAQLNFVSMSVFMQAYVCMF